MIDFKFEIWNGSAWEDYSSTMNYPLKSSDLLDEQLDEVEIFLKSVSREYFRPMTLCRLTITTTPETKFPTQSAPAPEITGVERTWTAVSSGGTTLYYTLTETLTKPFIIANDKAIEYPIGSGRFNHELYLIEATKIMEGYIGDTLMFTNPQGNVYTDDSENA